jgi:uncharacterized membrane protein
MEQTTDFEERPLTREEYISVMVHFYRGEVHRSQVWRQRLDATTNWAILTVAGMASFVFGHPESPPVLILLANLIVLAYLFIEARRYRYFEVYRARVRMLEENFLLPVVTRTLTSPMEGWREAVAEDLDRPKYKTTLLEAMGYRLRRNYLVIFLLVLAAWMFKVYIHPSILHDPAEIPDRIALGFVPAWAILAGGLLFYAFLVFLMWYARHIHGDAPADEIAGLERDLGKWKM